MVEPPTEEEMHNAITGNLSNLLVVVCNGLPASAHIYLSNADESRQQIQGLTRPEETILDGWDSGARRADRATPAINV